MISPAQTIQAKRPPAVKEIHVLWITAGLGCDGDSVSITAATQPSIEDVVLGAIPGLAQGASAQSGAGLRSRRRLHETSGTRPRRASSIRSCWSSKARFPTKRSRRKATGPRLAPIPTPASRSRPANGSIGWPPRPWPWWPPAPAPPTAASTPWRAIRPAAWAWPITWAGIGNRRPGCRSSTCPAARCSPTTSWRRCLPALSGGRAWPR